MHYVWLIWSTAFLIPWFALFSARPAFRREMLRVSLWTSLLGLTEPIFVPKYWNPPSLFNLAQRSGFDIESLIFCFAIGGMLFLALYAVFMLLLVFFAPDYIETQYGTCLHCLA